MEPRISRVDGRLCSIAGCTPSRPSSPGLRFEDRLEPVEELLHQFREVSITADEMLGRCYADKLRRPEAPGRQ